MSEESIIHTEKLTDNILITGCSRGLGLELVNQLSRHVTHLFATCLSLQHAVELRALAQLAGNVTLVEMDVTKEESIVAAYQHVSSVLTAADGLNCLVNNASVNLRVYSIEVLTADAMRYEYETNAIGAAMVVKTFLPLLRKAVICESGGLCTHSREIDPSEEVISECVSLTDDREANVSFGSDVCAHNTVETQPNIASSRLDSYKNNSVHSDSSIQCIGSSKACIINIASSNSSIGEQHEKSQLSYSHDTSKTALNMLTKTLSVELGGEGILVVSVKPEDDAVHDVVDCAARVVDVMFALGTQHGGLCVSSDGSVVPT